MCKQYTFVFPAALAFNSEEGVIRWEFAAVPAGPASVCVWTQGNCTPLATSRAAKTVRARTI